MVVPLIPDRQEAGTATTSTPKKSTTKFTKDQIVQALMDYAKEHDGKAPSSAEWWPARLRQFKVREEKAGNKTKAQEFERAAKAHERSGLPTTAQVMSVFGSWGKALKAASLKPRREGRKSSK